MARISRITAIGLLTLLQGLCLAGDFTVTPVRIFMSSRDRAVAITVINHGDTDLMMQAELFTWIQKPDGQDDLQPTDDLVMAPPIMKVPARSRQVLRLIRLSPPPAGEEQTYRMIVREVPEVKAQPEGIEMQIAIAFSMPVFLTPPGAKRQLACVPARAPEGKVVAQCENTGTAYAQVRSLFLLGAHGEKLAASPAPAYFLPRVKRTIELEAPGRVPAGTVKLLATMDDGSSQSFDGSLSE